MGYQDEDSAGGLVRYRCEGGNDAQLIDIASSAAAPTTPGAGRVYHIAFSVKDRAAQERVRAALLETGYQVTPVRDRDYFTAIYFRTPGGVLFEIATDGPGFDRDEDQADLGTSLKLSTQHAHLRDQLRSSLPPWTD